MKITLCQLASQYIHSALAPWYLKAAATRLCHAPHEITVVPGTVNESDDALLARLTAGEPQLIGLCCYIWNIAAVERLLPRLKRALPGCLVVLGGPEVSFCAEAVLARCAAADFVLCGEGERSFSALLDALAGDGGALSGDSGALSGDGGALAGVPGLCRRAGAGFVTTAPPPPLTRLFDPYTDDYFAALAGRIAYVETTRGCPFSCAYCLSGRADTLRRFDLEQSFAALLKLANSGSKTIKFVDRTFNADEKRALIIWRFLAAAFAEGRIGAGVCFHFEVAADLFSDEALSFLSGVPAGLFQMEAGLQSFHEPTLAAVQRHTDADRLLSNLHALLAGGNIHLHVDLIAGLPHEGLTEFARSFDRAFAIGAQQLQLGFLKLIYGSDLREKAAWYGMACTDAPPYEITRTDWLSERELSVLAAVETALGRLSNSGRFARSLPYALGLWQGGAFAFFAAFAAASAALGPAPHADQVGEQFFAFCQGIAGVSPAHLRDLLALDTMASRRLGRLPDFLKVPDARLGEVHLRLKSGAARTADIAHICEKFTAGRIAFCLLYTEAAGAAGTLALFDYTEKNTVTGQYAQTLVPLAAFLEQG